MTAAASHSGRRPRALRRALRWIALLLLAASAGFWAAKGAHRGWSQHKVPVAQKDEITGLDYVSYEDRFVPGVEFLAGGVGLAAALFALSFLIQRKAS